MSLLDLFKKVEPKAKMDDVEKVIQLFKQASAKEAIRFEVSNDAGDLLDCKIGGNYLQPLNAKPLMESMVLIAQINFAQLDLPYAKSGLLQFFIDGDDPMMGLDLNDPCNQEHFKVRYIKEADMEQYQEVEVANVENIPFEAGTCYKLIPHKIIQGMNVADYRFEQTFKEVTNLDYYKIDEEAQEAIYEALEGCNVQMFGYPFFTQYDPRENDYEEYELLFQLDSFRDIMWGDSGVANFFIKQKDLEKLDFSNILYNWDCY